MVYYFAYGSNLRVAQMQKRCPGAKPVGGASVAGWHLHVNGHGTVSAVPKRGGMLYGALWRLQAAHLPVLDRFEGTAIRHYRRHIVTAELTDGRRFGAIIYRSLQTRGRYARRDYMCSAVIPGARWFQLPQHWIDHLCALPIGGRVGIGLPQYRAYGVKSAKKSFRRIELP